MKFVYSKKYLDYHFEEGHPFWPERSEEFLELLGEKDFDFKRVKAPKAKDADILLAHSESYLKRVKNLVDKGGGYLSVDTSVNKDNLEASYYAVGGSIKASRLALKEGLGINLLGGFHHAETKDSSGFCIFNDLAIAIKKLQKEKKVNKVAVLDIDVHAGNGTQEIFYNDPTVLKISIHQDPTSLYPGTGFSWQEGEGEGVGYNLNYPLPPGTKETGYLITFDSTLPKIKEYNPDILFVIFGADTYKKDPLAGFNLEISSYGKIAERLEDFEPKVILCAGGYSKDVPEIWYEFFRKL